MFNIFKHKKSNKVHKEQSIDTNNQAIKDLDKYYRQFIAL